MKRLITSIVAMAAIISASAMSYSQAREQAWFLTDKMAYELYLNPAQMGAVYEINLDYIMNVDVMGDIFGTYWERRTRELSYVLTNSQMHTFLATEHFYRPITWVNSSFHFSVYDRYHRSSFYYSAPQVYVTYRGEYRKSTNSRFEGKFDNMKPTVTGRTLSTRTGVTNKPNGGMSNLGNGNSTKPGNGNSTKPNTGVSTKSNNGGTTGMGGTVTNGRTRPSDSMTSTATTKHSTNSGRSESKVTTVTRNESSVATATTSMGSVRSTTTNRTVNASNSSSSTAKSGATAGNSARRH